MLPKLKSLISAIQKRQRYTFVSLMVFIGHYMFAFYPEPKKTIGLVISFLAVLILFPLVQYASLSVGTLSLKKFISHSFLRIIILPFTLNLAGILALTSFPNLSFITKLGGILIVSSLMYLSCLVINIVLVVYEKGETIPLFRVASTWVQILSVVISIPLLSGVFKLNINNLGQSLVAGLIAALFTTFFLWVVDLDPEIPPISREEQLGFSLISGFVTFGLSISVSFIPTEAFLRSLLCASSMMSLQSYYHLHYKNLVTKRLMLEYMLVTLLFLFIVVIFH